MYLAQSSHKLWKLLRGGSGSNHRARADVIFRAETIRWRLALQTQRSVSKEAEQKVGQRVRAPVLIPVAIGKGLAEVEGHRRGAKSPSV